MADKTESFASIREAIAGSGTRVLSRPATRSIPRSRILTVEEVKAYDLENHSTGPLLPGERRASVTPYREMFDARNYWTSVQDTAPEIPDVPPVALDPTEQSFPAAGGAGSFMVTMTGPGWSQSWTVYQDAGAEWLILESPLTPQTVDGPVNYSVTANATGLARTGHFYVNGKTFTVTQAIS